MADISEILSNLNKIDTDLLSEKAMEQCADALVTENKKQLYAGYNREGHRLQQYRSAVYSEVKHRMNPLPGEGNPDLYATGAFYRGLYANVNAGEITIDSTDQKNEELQQKYHSEIMGLGGNFKAEFIEQNLQPAFISLIQNEIGL